MDPLLDFTHKSVLITGAASGFGRLLASAFASRGANLILGDINLDALQTLQDELLTSAGEVVIQRCDVSVEADCLALATTATERFGKLDIAINNAGIVQAFTPLEQTSEAVLDQQINVNVKGVLFGMKAQITQMRKQSEGVILNVSSMAGLGGAPKIGAYGAAKHAVIGLTKTAAAENARRNIRVNAICPFYSLTPMVTRGPLTEGQDLDDMTGFLSQGSPMKRLGKPEEIVAAMLLICSPANSYMTGQAIAIDGGLSAL